MLPGATAEAVTNPGPPGGEWRASLQAWKGPALTHPPTAHHPEIASWCPMPGFSPSPTPGAQRAHITDHASLLGFLKQPKVPLGALSLGKEMIEPHSSLQSSSSNNKVNCCLLSSLGVQTSTQPVRARAMGFRLGSAPGPSRHRGGLNCKLGVQGSHGGFFPPGMNPPLLRTGAGAETE